MIRKFGYCSIILFFFISSCGFAQEIKATARLDTTTILIGDQVNLDLSVTCPANTQVGWPRIGDTILKTIQVVNRTKIDSTLSQDKKMLTLRQKLLITSFDSGFYTIPPIRFIYRQLPDTAAHVAQTGILLLSVHTVSVDTTKNIKPIKGPLSEPLTFREILPWLLLGILLVLAGFGVWYYLKKRKKDEPVFTLRPKIQLSPHELALEELDKLRIKKLWQTGRVKEYHTELTDILRKYLEGRFCIMAMEMTSHEIFDSLSAVDEMQNFPMEKLNFILTMADLVKFAKMQPLPVENDTSMDHAVGFVKETAARKEQTVTND
jgi:hypothetical protein